MSRSPEISRESLDAEGRGVWDRIVAVRGRMGGPFQVLMHAPGLASKVAALEDYFRFDAELPAADRELVCLATVGEAGAFFAWHIHVPLAINAGTRPEAIEVVRANGAPDNLLPRDRLLIEMTRAMLRRRTLSDALYERALSALGGKQLVETMTLIGHYSMIGVLLNSFEMPPIETHGGDPVGNA